jgi:hypothetical protein
VASAPGRKTPGLKTLRESRLNAAKEWGVIAERLRKDVQFEECTNTISPME